MQKLETIEIGIENLVLLPRNSKIHNREQIENIKNSINEFGFLDPLAIWQNSELKSQNKYYVATGNGTLEALKQLGYKTVPCNDISNLSEDAMRAYAIAHNATTLKTGFDFGILKIETAKLDYDFADFGLEIDTNVNANISNITVEEKEFEISKFWQNLNEVEIGDIFEIGKHRLIFGDSTNSNDIKKLMNKELATMIFTDPPYNLSAKTINMSDKHTDFIDAHGEMSDAQFIEFLTSVTENLYANSKNGSIHFIWMDWRHIEHLQAACKIYDEFKNMCVWNKSVGGMGSFYRNKHELCFVYQKMQNENTDNTINNLDKCVWNTDVSSNKNLYKNAHELCLIYKKGKDKHINNFWGTGRYRTNVWDYYSQSSTNFTIGEGIERVHPTMKPIQMVADAILDCSNPNDIILDLFGGSGSTMVASQNTKRICYMCEKDIKFCNVIIRRMLHTFSGLEVYRNGVLETDLWRV